MGNCCGKEEHEIGLQGEHDEYEYCSDDEKIPEDGRGGFCGYQTGLHKQQDKHNPQLTRVRKKRWPTDVPCLILFVLFCVGMFVVGIGSFAVGSPTRLLQPTDYLGRLCGADNRNATPGKNLTNTIYDTS